MSRILFALLLYFLPAGVSAQKNIADSLYQLLKNEKADSNKVKLMCDIGYELRVNDPEKL